MRPHCFERRWGWTKAEPGSTAQAATRTPVIGCYEVMNRLASHPGPPIISLGGPSTLLHYRWNMIVENALRPGREPIEIR